MEPIQKILMKLMKVTVIKTDHWDDTRKGRTNLIGKD